MHLLVVPTTADAAFRPSAAFLTVAKPATRLALERSGPGRLYRKAHLVQCQLLWGIRATEAKGPSAALPVGGQDRPRELEAW